MSAMDAIVAAVCRDDEHRFSKAPIEQIVLLAGLGVQGDAHLGVTVQHRSRVAADPTQPNLRQCTSSTPSCSTRSASMATT